MPDQPGSSVPAEGTEGGTPAAPASPAPPAQTDNTPNPLQSEVDKWKGMSRQNEQRYNQTRTEKAALEAQLAEKDQAVAATTHTAAQDVALERLRTALADAGVKKADRDALIEVTDPSRLVADGKPSDDAITKAAKAFARSNPKGTDPDAGKGDKGKPANDMNQLLRAAAGFGS